MTTNGMPAASPVLGLHHFAHRCRNAEETRHFYEDILGMPLVHVIKADNVPSTGEYCPYVHIFFQMQDGSSVAFFDLGDNQAPDPSPNTPSWVNHLALRVPNVEALDAMKKRLEQHGISVLGVTDHSFVKSIYFFDPNGFRLEFTTQTATEEEIEEFAAVAHDVLKKWSDDNQHAGA